MRFFATCAKGLEYLLRDELVAQGAQSVREAQAGVHFEGALVDGYRACLESRLASRVLLPIARFDAADPEQLAAGVAAIDWSGHLAADGTLAVDAVCVISQIKHSQYAAQRVKDAIVDQFRAVAGTRPGVDLERPDLRLNLHLKRDQATLSIDLAGTSLHRRGWHANPVDAPLKENLAAAILLRGAWPAIHAGGGALVDPMCGSGTLLIEGALMAADVAPGLHRDYFGFLGWRGHDAALWAGLLADAKARAERGLRELAGVFYGSDIDPAAIRAAARNAQAAGVAGFIRLERHDVLRLQRPAGLERGLVVCNPPYGERLGERAELPALYRGLGQALAQQFGHWQAALIISDEALGHALGLGAHKRYRLYNGALECSLLLIDLAPRERREPKPLSDGALMLKNRAEKNWRNLRKRAEREGIENLRVYDRDLPEYAAAVDLYLAREELAPRAAPQRWLHVQEYQAPASVAEDVAQLRLRELVRVFGEVFEVPRERIALKTRKRGKGGARYGRFDARGAWLLAREGNLDFRINLFDYLDTGLFLDHRLVRAKLGELARGQSFLNLFAYTASASVHAAAGGASETTSVDLSATYLEWATRNLLQNGYSGREHRLVQADAMAFLASDRGRYGVIYVDPPTFSNSKRAEDFDVQRDHVALLKACLPRLASGGVVVFSNNYRRFRLDEEALAAAFEIEDWSRGSIPFDFVRNPSIHGCWLLRRRSPWAR